jgi:hypothetical protein
MKHRILFLGGVAALCSVAAACSDDSSCTTDSDCFAGEVCQSGSCALPTPNNSSNAAADAGNNAATDAGNNTSPNVTTNNNSGTDAGNNNSGTDAGNNNSGTDSGNNNAGTDAGNNSSGDPQCVADPFTVPACPDDGNDRFAERFSQATVGCQSSGFVPLDLTQTLRLCAVETADLYEVSMVECDDQTIRLEYVFEPLVSCDPALLDIDAWVQGKRCSEQEMSPDVQCGWNENGQFVAQFLVEDRRSIALSRIEIRKADGAEVDFEYDLTARVFQ